MSIQRTILSSAAWRRAGSVAAVAAIVAVAVGAQSAFTAPPSTPSSVVPVEPARILDTREPIGVPHVAPVGPDSTISVQVAGVGGVPAHATGVVMTLTAVNASAPTFVTATPTGTPRATTSVLNPSGPGAIANTITVGLGAGGKVDLYNGFGSVDLIADVTGYLVPEGSTPHIETGAIELTAYAANPRTDGTKVLDRGCVDLGNSGEVVLDVPLEHGSAVTSVTFHYYDNDAGDITFLLYEVDDVSNGRTTYQTLSDNMATSNGTAGYGRATITPKGADKVSADVRYVIESYTPGQVKLDTIHAFCGATVEYAREVS